MFKFQNSHVFCNFLNLNDVIFKKLEVEFIFAYVPDIASKSKGVIIVLH
jgi:hypothetical protein